MGFFDKIGQALGGGYHQNNPSWMRDQGQDIFNRFGDLYNAYNPQMEVAGGMENFDRMLKNQGAAQGNQLAARGFGAAANPNYNLTRARFGANLWTDANRHALDWRKNILGQQFGMLPGLEELFGSTRTQGLGGAIGNIAGQWAGKQGFGLGG